VLLTAVGFVLLIACAISLTYNWCGPRRAATSSGARRVGRDSNASGAAVLHRSMLLSAFAASAGLAIGAFAIDLIRGWRSPALPWLASVGLDPYVFGFTMGVAVVAAVLFGAAPAITGSRANLMAR